MKPLGFINIIKPTGMTSFSVVSRIKKILQTKKVGHLGTLDPAATGVLPIAVGKATKFFDYYLNKDKVYIARVVFGVETDTLDSFGNVLFKEDKVVKLDDIRKVLDKFTGEISQIPPKFSAIKIDGKRAYDLARQNIEFEIKPRKVKVYSITAEQTNNKNEFLFTVFCSAGTYIRTLMSDIAHEINAISTTFAIIRTKSGNFDINSAVTLEEFETSKKIISIKEAFSDKQFIDVNEFVYKKLINGVMLDVSMIDKSIKDNTIFFAQYNNELIGMYFVESGKAKCKIYLYESE